MKKVFVIIVTYNGMKWINECLESVLNSSLKAEIIIVDNNSSDETVNNIKTNFPNVKLFNQNQNLGFGKANNIGMSYALKNNADYVLLLNQDAKINKIAIEELINVSEKNTEFGIISPIHLNWDNTDVEYGFYSRRLFRDFLLGKTLKDWYAEDKFINASCWLLPKKTLETIGGFDPLFFHYGEDVNYCQRVLFHNFKIGVVPEAKVFHDTTNNGVIKKNTKEVQEMIDLRYFRNQILIKYANVNSNDYLSFKKYKINVIFKTFFFLITFDYKMFVLNLKKIKILNELDIANSYLNNVRVGSSYLE